MLRSFLNFIIVDVYFPNRFNIPSSVRLARWFCLPLLCFQLASEYRKLFHLLTLRVMGKLIAAHGIISDLLGYY